MTTTILAAKSEAKSEQEDVLLRAKMALVECINAVEVRFTACAREAPSYTRAEFQMNEIGFFCIIALVFLHTTLTVPVPYTGVRLKRRLAALLKAAFTLPPSTRHALLGPTPNPSFGA